jgi:hypothetical protein
MREEGKKTAIFRQFELSGYEKMIDRLMENPLQSSQAHDKPDMHKKILELKNALQVQSEKTRQGEMETQRQIILDLLKAKADAGETNYVDLKMKDLRTM